MHDEKENSKGHWSNDVIQVEAGVPKLQKGKTSKKVKRRKKPDQNKSDKYNQNKNNYSNTNGKNPEEAEEKDQDKSSLGIVTWNIHGLKKEKIEIFKHKSEPTVKKIFDENELICITETWRDNMTQTFSTSMMIS